MEDIQAAMKILEENLPYNISIINFIKNNNIYNIEVIDNSVIVRGESDRRWVYISSKSENELTAVIESLSKEDENFASIDGWMLPLLTKDKEVLWDLCMIQYYLPIDIRLPSAEHKTFPLTVDDANVVYENSEYKEYISIKYVRQCIQKGISAGLLENNKLVSWAITQDDGAIGFLHTLGECRKKGYGYNVTLSMIDQVRKNNGLPFANVLPSNERSINLLLKLGFKESKKIHWFQIV